MADSYLPALLSAFGSPADLGFHQGVVQAWDVLAGTNTILVNGSPFPNLRSLLGTEAGLIRQGDSVGLLRYQTSYFILGRITAAGSDQRSLGIAPAQVFPTASTTSTVFADLASSAGPSTSAYIGSSRRALILLSALSAITNTGSGALFGVEVGNSDGTVIPATAFNQGNNQIGNGAPVTITVPVVVTDANGLIEGDTLFTMKYRALGSIPQQTASFSNRQLIVIPF